MRPGFTWTAHQLLQVVQQSEAFLIRHRGEGLIGVNVLQTGHQVGQRVVDPKSVHLREMIKSSQEPQKKNQTVDLELKLSQSPAGPSSLPWL